MFKKTSYYGNHQEMIIVNILVFIFLIANCHLLHRKVPRGVGEFDLCL